MFQLRSPRDGAFRADEKNETGKEENKNIVCSRWSLSVLYDVRFVFTIHGERTMVYKLYGRVEAFEGDSFNNGF